MNKELRELLDKINSQKDTVRALVTENKLDEAKKAKEELKNMQAKFELLLELEDDNKQNAIKKAGEGKTLTNKEDPIKEFANAARRGFKNSMSEGVLTDGGYTVPEDIQTRINEYREAKFSLTQLVTVEPVSTNKGSRVYKKRTQQTGFSKVGENEKIGKKNTPQFTKIDYEIDKYGGYFPVTNELLEDSDANISSALISWIGDESRVTRNKIILGAVTTKSKTTFEDIDDIKKALNVTLGSAFKNTSSIITNDDGFQYLDTLKDSDGDYLLQPIITMPSTYTLFNRPVIVIPNADMPSDETIKGKRTIPFIVGDLKEGIVFYDRKVLTIASSNIASAGDLNAFEQDLTLFRAIEREDCGVRDDMAFVNGVITIDDSSVVGTV